MSRLLVRLALLASFLGACSSREKVDPGEPSNGVAQTGGSQGEPADSGGSGGTFVGVAPTRFAGDVTWSTDSVTFSHANFALDDDGSIANSNSSEVVTSTFDVIVIENDLVRVTVLPEYGGRILSIVYKPTGHEMLYQNPVAAPFGVDQGNFYYDWLMVYGGIFPTFPEAEHGKTWYLPWDFEIVRDDGDGVEVRMTFQDDIAPQGNVPPERFVYGRTDLAMTATVRVERGSSAVHLDLSLTNDRDQPVSYEYWTCTTLTPGSTPGSTASPANTEMIVPIEEVFSTYGWVNGVEQSRGENLFAFDQLRMFSSWSDAGILYAHPRMTEDHWGVINQDNQVGIFRIADAKVTPGLKFWTWGAPSVESNPLEMDERRPYIELWAGHSTQFFEPAEIGPQQTISWTEAYVPTVGLAGVTAANDFISADLDWEVLGETLHFSVELFSALPSIDYVVTPFTLSDVRTDYAAQPFTPDASGATTFTTTLPASSAKAGDQMGVVVQTEDGQVVFEATREFSP